MAPGRLVGAVAAALVALFSGGVATATVPVERPGRVATLGPPSPHWALVADILLRRNVLIDLDTGRFLGMISTGYNALTVVAPRESGRLYVPETFYSRGSRGERTDVVTIYDLASLAPVGEVVIPAKRAINLLPTANATLTDDGRFLLVFNLDPATSVSVVDTQAQRFVGEIPLPGCSLVYAAGDRRFFSLCADGSLLVVVLDDTGHAASVSRSERFFDPQTDPLTEKAVRAGDVWNFVSFEGMLHPIDVSGEEIRFETPWPLFDAAERAHSWRIGGIQHLAVHERSGRLFALVHQGGVDTPKDPGQELWVYDLASHRRVQRIELVHPGIDLLGEPAALGRDWGWPFHTLYDWVLRLLPANISSVIVTRDDAPLLVTASAMGGGSLAVYDALSGRFLRRVTSSNLTVQRLDAPFDGGGSR